MESVHKNGYRILYRLIAGLPFMFVVSGILLVGIFGYDYLQQTLFINHHKLPMYHTSENKLWNPKPQAGMKIGELMIPSVGIQVPIIEGTDEKDLKLGAGHYEGSALPGQGDQVYLAGHRDTVFMKVKNVKIGDKIEFSSQYGTFVYEVTGFNIVHTDDTTVLNPTHYETLTLQTCYPFYFIGDAPDRYIVHTKYIGKSKAR